MSSTSSYSQSSFSPTSSLSSPYTPSSQTSESFGNDNVFKFPPSIQEKYIVSTITYITYNLSVIIKAMVGTIKKFFLLYISTFTHVVFYFSSLMKLFFKFISRGEEY